jgi:hypothetical protein
MSSNILTLGCDWQRVAERPRDPLYAHDDDGKRLDAKYEVEPDSGGLALIMASASGRHGDRPGTNTDYKEAFLVLLTRLKDLGAVLDDALVDTDHTRRRGDPEDERRIIDLPLKLSALADVASLRNELLYRQSRVAQTPGAKRDGSARRTIRLRLSVPGYTTADSSRLEIDLAQPIGEDIYQSADETRPEPGQTFTEGAVKQVTVNKYERDRRARRACLDVYGFKCVVCDLDFEVKYGEVGRGFIHVHHLRELSKLGPDYTVDPVKDLRPVCPNCHAMLHTKSPALLPEDLKRQMPPAPAC